jgi:hypothetical protein
MRSRHLLGRRLRPFSLFHRIVLEEMKSPIILGGNVSPSDLMLAVRVMSSDSVDEIVGSKPSMLDGMKWGLLSISNTYYAYAIAGLRQHIKESCAWPEVLQKAEKDGEDRGVPWVANVVATMVKYGMPLKEVLHSAEGQIIWVYVCIGITEGAEADIMSSDLEAELQRMVIQEYLDKHPQEEEAK